MVHRPIEVSTLVVKLASRCNMDCGYCYIYHGQDQTWRDMPFRMEAEVAATLIDQVKQLYLNQLTKPHVVFHGGEPLLYGINRLALLVKQFVDEIPDIQLSIQTNGTIYNTSLESLLLYYRDNLSYSVSVDGWQHENDRHRLGRRHQSVFRAIEKNLLRARSANVLDNILMVVDIENDPARIFEFICAAGAQSYNLLLQDGDHVRLPRGKDSFEDKATGCWLWELFKLYVSGDHEFRIKLFDDIVTSLLKLLRNIKSPPATYSLATVTIDTNGEIKQSDIYRINANNADRLAGTTIRQTSIQEAQQDDHHIMRLKEIETLCDACTQCRYLDVCGGGYPSHRSRNGNFLNPSIYCNDYKYLFGKIEELLCS